jgi:hypothetical protein
LTSTLHFLHISPTHLLLIHLLSLNLLDSHLDKLNHHNISKIIIVTLSLRISMIHPLLHLNHHLSVSTLYLILFLIKMFLLHTNTLL